MPVAELAVILTGWRMGSLGWAGKPGLGAGRRSKESPDAGRGEGMCEETSETLAMTAPLAKTKAKEGSQLPKACGRL